jgi:hypothetical protein
MENAADLLNVQFEGKMPGNSHSLWLPVKINNVFYRQLAKND